MMIIVVPDIFLKCPTFLIFLAALFTVATNVCMLSWIMSTLIKPLAGK